MGIFLLIHMGNLLDSLGCPLTPDDDPKFFIRSQKTKEVITPDKPSMEAGDQMLESTKYVVFMLMTKPQSY